MLFALGPLKLPKRDNLFEFDNDQAFDQAFDQAVELSCGILPT